MDIHQRYMILPTIDASMLDILNMDLKQDPSLVISRLIRSYNDEIINNKIDLRKLETFRMILCYEYQSTFNPDKKNLNTIPTDISFEDIENILIAQQHNRKIEEATVMHDIILLQMILYCTPAHIKQHVTNFLDSWSVYIFSNTYAETRITYMNILECFLDSLDLYSFVHKCQKEFVDIGSSFVEKFISWFILKDNNEWQFLALILPKLVSVFDCACVLPRVWTFAIDELTDCKQSLTALCIITGMTFPKSIRSLPVLCYSTHSCKKFWLLVIEGLKSSIQQDRKQALFVIKRAADCITTENITFLKTLGPDLMRYICNQPLESDEKIVQIWQKFFLVFEALEEKQYHLIGPALAYVPTLIEKDWEYESHNNNFNIVCLRVLYGRILRHENNSIVKWGISSACALPIIIFDDEFLELFLNALNNTFLYECQAGDKEHGILDDITILFMHALEHDTKFINRSIIKMSQIAWGPIPIFYIMQSLQRISSNVSINIWDTDTLDAIKSLISKDLNMHSHILRIASQIELLKMICNSSEKVRDLISVAHILAKFPSEEAFMRGSFSWKAITLWLSKMLLKVDIENFIIHTLRALLDRSVEPDMNPKAFALMVFLLHESGLLLCDQTCSAGSKLHSCLSSLNGIDVRLYADLTSTMDIIEFMSCLLCLNAKQKSINITTLLSSHVHGILRFLMKLIKTVGSKLDNENLERYLNITTIFLNNGHQLIPKKEMILYIEQFKEECICVIQNVNERQIMAYLTSLHILYVCQNLHTTPSKICLTKPILQTYKIKILIEDNQEIIEKGKIASNHYSLVAKLTNQYLIQVSADMWLAHINWLEHTIELFDLGGKEIIPIIASILNTLVDKKTITNADDRSKFKSAFEICWKHTMLNKKNNIYWEAINNLISVIINNNFACLPDAMEFSSTFLDELLEEAENTPKLKMILLTHMKNLDVCYLKSLHIPLLNCLIHGHALRRDKRIENQTYSYIVNTYKSHYPEHMSATNCNVDAAIRSLSVILLHKMISTDSEYADAFLPFILEKLEKYKNKRYFNNSYLHKVKHRLMQILLLLEPVLSEASLFSLQEAICNLMLLESNQHSVRLMQEWILTKIFIRNHDLHIKLWKFFQECINKRPTCTTSVASIVYHTSKYLPNSIQSNFIQVGLPYIAQCCLGQQFNMRLYNQMILVKLYELLKTLKNGHVEMEYNALYAAASENLRTANFEKNSNKIQDDFYFAIFQPLDHYSLQSIYLELPRLTDMDAEEYIIPNIFIAHDFVQNCNHPIKLFNFDESLAQTNTSMYLSKSCIDGVELLAHDIKVNSDGLNDIQKKIDPLNTIASMHSDILPVIRDSHKSVLSDKDGIIVVASLINRTPNLGGLARTCEVFGVKELVIANLHHTKDREFQNLSVSAEKWITLTEVKPHELQKYLLERKHNGWSLIGAEQTANSASLPNMKFSKKTILVLGNEKDGIPANLIPLFDMCIEIPQVGFIRSLNVHVAGAICIWQYAIQHVLK